MYEGQRWSHAHSSLHGRMSSSAQQLERERPFLRESGERVQRAERRLHKALGDVRLFLYADATLDDPEIAEQMHAIGKALETGQPFYNARQIRGGSENGVERPHAAFHWEPSPTVERWLECQSEWVVSAVLDFLPDLCDRPDAFPAVQLDGESAPRQFASVPGTDVVIVTYTVTLGEPPIVHGLKMERDNRFWSF